MKKELKLQKILSDLYCESYKFVFDFANKSKIILPSDSIKGIHSFLELEGTQWGQGDYCPATNLNLKFYNDSNSNLEKSFFQFHYLDPSIQAGHQFWGRSNFLNKEKECQKICHLKYIRMQSSEKMKDKNKIEFSNNKLKKIIEEVPLLTGKHKDVWQWMYRRDDERSSLLKYHDDIFFETESSPGYVGIIEFPVVVNKNLYKEAEQFGKGVRLIDSFFKKIK